MPSLSGWVKDKVVGTVATDCARAAGPGWGATVTLLGPSPAQREEVIALAQAPGDALRFHPVASAVVFAAGRPDDVLRLYNLGALDIASTFTVERCRPDASGRNRDPVHMDCHYRSGSRCADGRRGATFHGSRSSILLTG
jgi:hypothetical protein